MEDFQRISGEPDGDGSASAKQAAVISALGNPVDTALEQPSAQQGRVIGATAGDSSQVSGDLTPPQPGDAYYRQMFEKNLAVKLLIDPATGDIVDANPAASAFYGYSLDELRRKKISDINTLPFEQVRQEMSDARSEQRNHFHFQHRLASGEVRDVEVYSSPLEVGDRHLLFSIIHDITERRRAEAQTQLSLSLLQATLDASADGILAVDLHGRVVSYNRRFCQMWHVPADALPNIEQERLLQFLSEQARDPHTFIAQMRSMDAQPRAESYDIVNLKDGRVIERYSQSQRMGGKVVGRVWSFRDITDRVNAEEQIRQLNAGLERRVEERTALLQTILETTPVGMVYYDRDMRITNCNIAWERFSDVKLEDIRGRSLYDLYPVTKSRRAIHQRALNGEATDEQNVPFVHEVDGTTHFYDISYRPIRGESGEVTGILNTVSDVTESVRIQQEIERQRKTLKAIVEGSPVGIALFDRNMRLVDFNTNWAAFTGVDPGVAPGQSLYDISPYSNESKDLHARVLGGENVFLQDTRYTRRAETKPSYYDIYYSPLPDQTGAIGGVLIAVVDVTHRHELDRQKDDFLALASHELKTPVTTIKGSAQVARRTAQQLDDEKLIRLLGIVEEQANRLTRLINELLDVTHTGAGMLAMEMEPLDLREPIEAVVRNIELTAPDFTFELDLPPVPTTVRGDRQRLEQVLTNLVHNAVKYSGDERKVEVTASIREDDSGPEVVVAVRDNGVGVPAEQQPHVFERFFRGRNVDIRHYDGLGLGLFIAHGIISTHSGRMWLESVEGQGSTFYFSLPLL